ncbi:TPA: hypothetical protein ACGSNN_001690 [Acinetobacter baumannii]
MYFIFENQEIKLDQSKIIPYLNSYLYQDILLCNSDGPLYLNYKGKELIVNTERYKPFLSTTIPQMNVKIQWMDTQLISKLNTLSDIDQFLTNNKNEKIPLTPIQQNVIGIQDAKTFDFRYEREIIIKNLSKALQDFVK